MIGGKPVRQPVSAQQLDVLAGMYHLTHNTDKLPWKRTVQIYKNEAEEPVIVRTAFMTPAGREYRIGRFQLAKKVHAKLLELGGHYLFIAYRQNSHGIPTIVHHALHPASKFVMGAANNTKIHPRDVFTGVVG